MNLRDIEYILAAATTGSFAKAARQCHVSQPSLSVQIKKVEQRLGCALFIRDKQGVYLTEFGNSVRQHFEAIRDNVSKIEQQAALQNDRPEAALRLGAIATAAPYIFAHIANIGDMELTESTTLELIKHLLDDSIDVALLALPIQVPQLRTLSLYREPFYLGAANGNRFVDQIDLETMQPPPQCRFLVLSEEHCMGEQTAKLCKMDRAASNRVFKASSLETVRHMVSTSDDITLIPAMARRDHDGLDYHPLPVRYHRNMGLVYKADNPHIDRIHTLHHSIRKLDFVEALS